MMLLPGPSPTPSLKLQQTCDGFDDLGLLEVEE